MSDTSRFAAIWPLKAKTKADHQIVSVSHIKNFKEKKKYGTDLFRFKPPGAEKSSLVFILLTGNSKEEVQESLTKGRIIYPNRSLIEPNMKMTTSEEEPQSNALEQQKVLKSVGKARTAEAIIQKHISRGAKIKPVTKLPEPLQNTSSSTNPTASSLTVTSPLDVSLESQTSSQDGILNPPAKRLKKNFSSQTDNTYNEKQLTSLQQQATKNEEEISVLEAKFQSYQLETQQQMESLAKNHQDLIKRVAVLERSTKSKPKPVEKLQGSSSSSNLPSSSNGPTYHLTDTRMVTLGHGVEVDADVWESLANARSKDDWAYGALLAVFGAESKFYRARKPRGKDQSLRVFPTSPPVVPVLKHFYKKWLRDHVAVIDSECGIDYAKKKPEEEQDWASFLEEESPEAQTERRKAKVLELAKKLPALMADKATNMYRQGHRSKQRFFRTCMNFTSQQ